MFSISKIIPHTTVDSEICIELFVLWLECAHINVDTDTLNVLQ